MEFGEKLHTLRERQNMTQQQLADKLYVSRTAVSKWETGKGYPNLDSLKAISEVFEISINDLLSGEQLMTIAKETNKNNIKYLGFLLCRGGANQLIKRKSFFKVDAEILLLGVFYIAVIAAYIFFEKVVVNSRPVLMDGYLEASYPSTHTMISLSVFISAAMAVWRLCGNKSARVAAWCVAVAFCVFTVVGRFVSGAHWFTDIIGGVLLASALLAAYYTTLIFVDKKKMVDKQIDQWYDLLEQ